MIKNNIRYKIGIDEVGRGPLAGPVAVCATLLEVKNEVYLKKELEGIKDSKKLTEKKREEYFKKIKVLKDCSILFSSLSFVSSTEIDKNGIISSIKKAIEYSLKNLLKNEKLKKINLNNVEVLLDGGLKAPEKFINQKTIIGGDDKEFVISITSVIAKVLRDRRMKEYGNQFPQYLFEKHKGYGTKAHREAIQKHSICSIHRKSFLKNIL